MLQARLDRAIALYHQGYFKIIFVSGGHGKDGHDEAVSMRLYLEKKGIPHAAIFEDNEGINTWATARNTAAFLKAHRLSSVLIISQYFHVPRCRLAFWKFGITPAYASHAHYYSPRDLYYIPREVAGLVAYSWRSTDQVFESE